MIATGGGPGLMEAANRGASEAGAPSTGFNITLPKEQQPNPSTTPHLTVRFHSFTMRKMHLAMRARGLAVFPGGFGTLDELFDLLTLRQTRKMPPCPIVLVGDLSWRTVIDLDAMREVGLISTADAGLMVHAGNAEEASSALLAGDLTIPTGRLIPIGCSIEPPAWHQVLGTKPAARP